MISLFVAWRLLRLVRVVILVGVIAGLGAFATERLGQVTGQRGLGSMFSTVQRDLQQGFANALHGVPGQAAGPAGR